jgi:NADH-quinone oxidoreductase subunit L
MTGLLWVLVALPGVAGLLLLVAGRRADRLAAPVAVAVAAVVAALAIGLGATTRGSVSAPLLAVAPLRLRLDALGAGAAITVALIALAALIVAMAEIEHGRWRFHGLMLIFLAAVLLTVLGADVPALLGGWEVMGATSWALIAFRYRDGDNVSAGATAFLTTRTADLGLYLTAGAALGGTRGLGSDRLALDRLGDLPSPWLHVAAGGVLIAALGKAAQLPFSFWLRGAMRGPSAVSALLHSAAMVAMGGYLLLRMHGLLVASGWAATAAAWVGALTALVLGGIALLQSDLKQLLAASTCAQLGYVVLAAGVRTDGAQSAGLAQLIAHAATKALLFLGAGVWLHALGTKRLLGLVGAARIWPGVGAAFVVGALALAGVPPLSLWASKDSVLGAAAAQSTPLYLVGLAGSVLAAGYAGRALGIVLRPRTDAAAEWWGEERTGRRRVSALETAPLVVLGVAAAGLGVLELPPVADRLAAALGEAAPVSVGWVALLISAALAVATATAAAIFADRIATPRWAAAWLGLPDAAQSIARSVRRTAQWLAHVDDAYIDRVAMSGAGWLRRAATAAAHADDVGIDGLVARSAHTVQRAADWARRPQTGLVHQYLAQAAILLVAAVLLIVLAR